MTTTDAETASGSAPGGSARRGRRPQPERRAAMQARILDATVDCLVELGWAGTTLPEVIARAGVARGAQVHHFPTKASLIAAVGDHLLERNRREFAAAFEALAPDERTLDAALDLLWSILHGSTWTAVIELGLASRTDAMAAAPFRSFTERVDTVVLEIVGEYFPALAENPIGVVTVRGSVALLSGLALMTSIDGDRLGRHAEVFAHFKQLCTLLSPSLLSRRNVGPNASPPPSGTRPRKEPL